MARSACAQGAAATRAYWGAETNGLKAGVFFNLAPGSTNQVQVFFVPAINNSLATNGNFLRADRLHLWLPPFDSRYRMQLTDEAGSPVRKTHKGKTLAKPYVYSPPQRVTTAPPTDRAVMLAPNEPQSLPERASGNSPFAYRPLSLLDYFKVTNSGKYHLKFQISVLFWTMQNPSDLHLVALPAVEADLDLQLPPKRLSLLLTCLKGHAKDYGVDILGLTLCAAGTAWLIGRRLRRKPPASPSPNPT
jgi:hypothetical protein